MQEGGGDWCSELCGYIAEVVGSGGCVMEMVTEALVSIGAVGEIELEGGHAVGVAEVIQMAAVGGNTRAHGGVIAERKS